MATNYALGDLQAADTAILATAISVTNAATLLPTTALAQRRAVIVFNNAVAGGQTVFLGDTNVTTVTGFPLAPQGSVALDLGAHVSLFGITAASTADVRVLEIS